MTIFALHPAAIIQGWLLQRLWLLTIELQYIANQQGHSSQETFTIQ